MRTYLAVLCSILLFALPGHVSAQPLPTLEVIPAWQGLFRPHKNTELQIRIRPQQSSPATLFISGSSINKQIQLQLTAGIIKELVIPIRLTNKNIITLRLESPDQAPTKKTVWFDLSADGDRVIAMTVGQPTTLTDISQLNISAKMLPHHSQAYEMIDTLVIDATTLSAISIEQLQALENFIFSCGQLIAVAMPQQVVAALTENSGCHGNSIKVINDYSQIGININDLFSAETAGIRGEPENFRPLARDALLHNRLLGTVIGFFLLYLLALLMTRILTRRAEALIGVSITASLLAALAWSGNNPEVSTYTWLELDSGENTARYSMLFQQIGNGLGQASITIPTYLYDPVTLNSNNAAFTPIHMDIHENSSAELVLPTALLNRTELYFDGKIQYDNRISLINRDGSPQVINHSDRVIENAFLLWQDEVINLPLIQPKASWSNAMAGDTSHADVPIDISRMLDRYGANYKHALFIQQSPHFMRTVTQDKSQLGWLIIHAEFG